jgi:Tfp pilus assembly protein FimT
MNSPSITASRPLSRGVFSPRRASQIHARSEGGFSLLELAIVVGLLLVATTIALLMAENVTRSVRLQTTASDYASLLQQARLRAVQDDKYYTVVTVPSSGTTPAMAFIDLDGNGQLSNGEPQMVFPSDVKSVSFGSAPAKANLEAQFLPAGTTGTINTAQGPTFGPRGIPCAPTTVGSYTTCPFTQPTSYMAFMKNSRSLNYEAITVTPAGRIHLWSYGSSGTWSPMN